MSAMKLCLVSFPASDSPEALPLGAASVAAAVKTAAEATPALRSAELAMVSGGLGEGSLELATRIAAAGPQAVGFSVYTWNREKSCKIAQLLRAASPELILFAGGPEATADPEGLIAEGALDFSVVGEGEGATVEALRAIIGAGLRPDPARRAEVLRGIRGIALPGEAWKSARPGNPATLPSPWLLGTIDPKASGGDVVWELSRGCPFRCAYCYESKGTQGSRPFPMERIEAELELFVRSDVRYAFVLDPTFDADPKRAAALLDLLRRKAPGIRWKFEVRAELLDKELVRRFAALDCGLQIGLQSVNAATLATVGRPGFDRKEFARKAAMLDRAGICFGIDLIYGLPGDSLDDFREGLDFALGLGPNHLDLFPLALLPGTELADKAGELGLEADPRPPYLVRTTRQMPPQDLEMAARLARACDRLYTAGRAVAWFDAARKPLRMRASALLEAYASSRDASLAAGGDAPAEIEREQLAFIEGAYERAGLGNLAPALRDLVRLHGAWGRALAEGEESLLELSYDPDEVLGAAASGLAAFARAASPTRGTWRVLPDEVEGARLEKSGRAKKKEPRGRP
jgi:radical SAM superfamily enzyme YgiQ (UPF0313 family)